MLENGKKKSLPGRDPVKRDEIAAYVCAGIAQGKWLPGDRLPGREELLAQFGVSMATLQNAVEVLLRDGFIRSERGCGTFVAERPPCTHRFAVITTKEDIPNCFQQKLVWSAETLGREKGFEIFSAALNLFGMQLNPEKLNSILDQIDRHLFAGILMIPYFPKEEIPAHARAAGIPLTRLYDNDDRIRPDIVFDLKFMEPVDLIVKKFLMNKVKRVSILSWNEPGSKTSVLIDGLISAGIDIRPEWVVSIPLNWQMTGSNIIRLLFSLPEEQRPDGLFVADDNLLPLVLAEAKSMNICIPEDLFVAVQYNFPGNETQYSHIWKIGPDTGDIINYFFEYSELARKTPGSFRQTIEVRTS